MPEVCVQCGSSVAVRPGDGLCPQCRKPFDRPTGETRQIDRSATEELPRQPVKDRPGGAPIDAKLLEADLERLPRRVNNYELLEVIGRGGMGVVYRARHVPLERFVALKLVRRVSLENDEALRFIAEAQVTGQIEHPNIVPVHEVGTDERGRPYFVMKLVRGRSLSQILVALEKRDPATLKGFPVRRLLGIFCDVCQAVAFAHSKGVVHRDLKPGNVMIGDFGEVLLMDWGLAKKIGAPEGATERPPGSTRDGQVHTVRDHHHDTSARFVAGTPEYMSPEQALGEPSALQPRSDVYSLGAMLFELLTFRPPHLDPDTTRLIVKVTNTRAEFPLPGPYRPRVHKALRAIALKALAINPEERYRDALDLMQDIRAFTEDRPVSACPDTLSDRTARLFRRHGPMITTVAAALLVFSVGASLWFWQSQESKARLLEAERKQDEERRKRLDERELRLEAEDDTKKEAKRREAAETRAAEERRAVEDAKRRELENLSRAMPLYLHGIEMLQRRQYDAAVKQLEAVIAAEPPLALARLAHFACGEAYEKKSTRASGQAAIAHFTAADALARKFSNDPTRVGDARALLRCAEISWRLLKAETDTAADDDASLRFYQQAASGDPLDPYARLAHAYLLILDARKEKNAETRKEKAREALELALQILGSGNPLWEAHFVAGSLYAGQELAGALPPDHVRALQHFTLALDLEPNQPDSLLGRAQVARKLGDRSLAMMDYTNALRLRPDAKQAWPALAELLLETDRPDEAFSVAGEALKRTPQDAALLGLQARALIELKRWADARSMADQALLARPNDAALLFLRARAAAGEGRFAEAVTDLNEVLRAEPEHLDALQLRADCRLRIGQAAEAEADFRRLLERAPARSELWRGLGNALSEQKRDKEALEAFTTYVSQQPGDIEIRLRVARLLSARPETAWFAPEKAVLLAREAERLKPDGDPQIQIVLAEALLASGKDQEAIQQIERAYTRFPTSTDVQQARERLRAAKTAKPKK
jgi:serine/threonine protein kinase/Tfp pilus assembly protein PilF